MITNLKQMATFGIAGNFTGHLEQAGEAKDFVNVKTAEQNAPKGIFPTYIPCTNKNIPSFLNQFPFSEKTIIFPQNEENLQIEPECAIIYNIQWNENTIESITPLAFGASNDCSIRKDGATKISQKKNWGPNSKGLSENLISIDKFSEEGIINDYKIACFLIRDNKIFTYGETSFIKDYSYIYQKLNNWIIEKLNNQKDEGPTENLNSYLTSQNKPSQIMISIGATRYTDFGKNNFLQSQDKSVVVLYPNSKYTDEEILSIVKNQDYSHKDISLLCQEVVLQ